MAKKQGKLLPQIDVRQPVNGQPSFADANNMVLVRVHDDSGGVNAYTATMTDLGTNTVVSWGKLAREGTSNFYSVCLPVRTLSHHVTGVNNNQASVWVVQAASGTGDSDDPLFEAVRGGSVACAGAASGSYSGSFSSSASGIIEVEARQRCDFCSPDQPVPVALVLKLDSPVAAGTCANCAELNRPALLLHSNDPKYACHWFSQPIDFCADPTKPGIWALHKRDHHTWVLSLNVSSANVVTYRLTTAHQACSFPIQLHLVGAPGGECQNWPATVSAAAAP